jgi:tetratricopeptide (TPR) repeat protein
MWAGLKHKGIWWLAVQEYRDALQADPELAPAHFNLAEVQAGSGGINEAIGHYREALRIDPDFAYAHYHLAVALLAKGRRDEVLEDYPSGVESLNKLRGLAQAEATAYYWQAYLNDPAWVAARNSLRIPNADGARLDEAIDHYRQAIRLEPRWDRPHGGLGQALLAKRQFAAADAALARCLELLPSKEAELRGNLERLRERCRRLMALDGRLADIVRGTDTPAADECLDAAELCFVNGHHAPAARLYAEALAAAPRVTEDLPAGHRFNAARAAALAGLRRADDPAEPGEPERERLRNQAREWLRQDLSGWAAKVDSGQSVERLQARRALSPWRDEPDLAGLREPEALDRLSPAERRQWRSLWGEVDVLIQRARAAGEPSSDRASGQ